MRKRRKQNVSKRAQNFSYEIMLFHQKIPREKFEALSETDRYCFLLMGHVHNELSWLRRMTYIASRSGPNECEASNSGNMMQATFLVRMLLGKLFEFKNLLGAEHSIISKFISDYFHPDATNMGTDKVKEIIDCYGKDDWIRAAKNKHFLHYPTLSDVRETLSDKNIEWEPEIYHGVKSSNTFYPTSDVLANYAWFRLVSPDRPMEGLDFALLATRELSKLVLQALEQSMGNFIDINLAKIESSNEIKIEVPGSLHLMKLDYFMQA